MLESTHVNVSAREFLSDTAPHMTKPTIFISYSHMDEEWKDRLRPHLKMLEQAGLGIVIWDDRS